MTKNACFASDNCGGVHPAVMDALREANRGHALSYGDDPWTRRAEQRFRDLFGHGSSVYFVYNGTGANTLSVGALVRSWQAVISTEIAHLSVDETGAPEKFAGCKILTAPGDKLTPDAVEERLSALGSMHQSQPALISLTNPTEAGTLYTPDEIAALASMAHRNGMRVHMDGARIANAAAALSSSFREITRDCGVDVLSLGATKSGLMFGEAVVFMDAAAGAQFPYIRKHGAQLHSKMRYIAAQYLAWLSEAVWRPGAARANALATRLSRELSALPGVEMAFPTQANGVFVNFPVPVAEAIAQRYFFYDMEAGGGRKCSRLMCGFDTPGDEADALLELARRAAGYAQER